MLREIFDNKMIKTTQILQKIQLDFLENKTEMIHKRGQHENILSENRQLWFQERLLAK